MVVVVVARKVGPWRNFPSRHFAFDPSIVAFVVFAVVARLVAVDVAILPVPFAVRLVVVVVDELFLAAFGRLPPWQQPQLVLVPVVPLRQTILRKCHLATVRTASRGM